MANCPQVKKMQKKFSKLFKGMNELKKMDKRHERSPSPRRAPGKGGRNLKKLQAGAKGEESEEESEEEDDSTGESSDQDDEDSASESESGN